MKVEVDWSKYRELFPERYLRRTEFDRVFWSAISELHLDLGRRVKFLDIGGGTQGNEMPDKVEYYLLDTGVIVCDKKVTAVGWESVGDLSYDVVRMRGSIAYLSVSELLKVARLVRHGSGVAFNIFRSIDYTRRDREYSVRGRSARESISMTKEPGMAVHTIQFEGSKIEYVSRFYVRSLEWYIGLLDPNLEFGMLRRFSPPNSSWCFIGDIWRLFTEV